MVSDLRSSSNLEYRPLGELVEDDPSDTKNEWNGQLDEQAERKWFVGAWILIICGGLFGVLGLYARIYSLVRDEDSDDPITLEPTTFAPTTAAPLLLTAKQLLMMH